MSLLTPWFHAPTHGSPEYANFGPYTLSSADLHTSAEVAGLLVFLLLTTLLTLGDEPGRARRVVFGMALETWLGFYFAAGVLFIAVVYPGGRVWTLGGCVGVITGFVIGFSLAALVGAVSRRFLRRRSR